MNRYKPRRSIIFRVLDWARRNGLAEHGKRPTPTGYTTTDAGKRNPVVTESYVQL